MTPADLARQNAISFECKKDALQQRQSGDWKVSFTVQGVDMDGRLTRAAMGTRFVAVLVEVNDSELPVQQPRKEAMQNLQRAPKPDAQPAPDTDKPSVGAKRKSWETLLPQQQAAMRGGEPAFTAFLKETYPDEWHETTDADQCLKLICGVASKRDLEMNHKARVIWTQLDSHFQAWERVGA